MILPIFKKPDLDTICTVVILALLLMMGWGAYKWAYDRGAASVQNQWDKAKQAQQTAITQLQRKYDQDTGTNQQQIRQLTQALTQGKQDHEQALAALRADAARRLQSSETRAGVYQRQAAAGAAQCRDLASHAARLDASLEEGRSLVWELRATLGQRDEQVKLLGTQLLNDRILINGN